MVGGDRRTEKPHVLRVLILHVISELRAANADTKESHITDYGRSAARSMPR